MMSSPRSIGVVGLGNMGMPIARRLLGQGFDVIGHDVEVDRVEQFAAHGGRGGRDAALSAPVLCMATPDEKPLATIVDDPAWNAQETVRTVILFSTVLPGSAQQIASRLQARRIALIEAPVSGGAAAAGRGELTLFVSGDQGAIDAVADVTHALARRTHVVGAAGAASAVKLANQLALFATLGGIYEAIELVGPYGVAEAGVVAAITDATGDSWAARNLEFFRGLVAEYDEAHTRSRDRPWRKDLQEVVRTAAANGTADDLARTLAAVLGDRLEAHARATDVRGDRR